MLVEKITHDKNYLVSTNSGNLGCQSLVIVTGVPRGCSTDFGMQIAKQFGLHSIPFYLALLPFTFEQIDLRGILRDLSGVALDVRVECNNQLFTHRGLSDPTTLQISSYWKRVMR